MLFDMQNPKNARINSILNISINDIGYDTIRQGDNWKTSTYKT